MKENKLKHIDGKKIRRQFFNAPLIILYSLMLAIPYFIFVISLCVGKFDPSAWPSTLWTSVLVCFSFSLPLLILRILYKHFLGKIVCVLSKEGIHYPKGMLRWETIEKIEYAIDSKPRYKSDTYKGLRAIIYTRGGKHVVLENAPMRVLSKAKKYHPDLNVQISGAASLVPVTLILAAIIIICPFYVVLLKNAPGASDTQLIVLAVVLIVSLIIRTYIFNTYAIEYLFWRRILPNKWLSYIVLGCYYSSFFAAFLVLSYFPNWVVVALVGIFLGVVRPPTPSRFGGNRYGYLLSYEQLCERYIGNADYFEKYIEKLKEKRLRK